MFHQYLEKLGFSEKEIAVYLALTELGKATASALSAKTKIPRATVYIILASLDERGVITVEEAKDTTYYVMKSPASFVSLVHREKDELKEKEKAALELQSILEPYLTSFHHVVPKLQLYEGKKNVEAMLYENLPDWRKSMERVGDTTLWGYQDDTFVEQYRKWHDHLWSTMSDKEQIRLFSNRSSIEKELTHRIARREVRVLPDDINFTSSIWLYGEYIILGMTRAKPHYVYQLKDAMFASNLRAIFHLLWRSRFD